MRPPKFGLPTKRIFCACCAQPYPALIAKIQAGPLDGLLWNERSRPVQLLQCRWHVGRKRDPGHQNCGTTSDCYSNFHCVTPMTAHLYSRWQQKPVRQCDGPPKEFSVLQKRHRISTETLIFTMSASTISSSAAASWGCTTAGWLAVRHRIEGEATYMKLEGSSFDPLLSATRPVGGARGIRDVLGSAKLATGTGLAG